MRQATSLWLASAEHATIYPRITVIDSVTVISATAKNLLFDQSVPTAP